MKTINHAAIMVAAWALVWSPDAAADELPAMSGAFYALSVQDLERATAWYQDHLDFVVQSEGSNEQRSGALLTRPGVILELAQFTGAVALDELQPELESHQVFGIFKLGFSTLKLDDTFHALEKGGVTIFFPIVSASDDQRTFGIKDPDGNIIQFFGD